MGEPTVYAGNVGEPWLREKLMPVSNKLSTLGGQGANDGQRLKRGMWQITLFYPKGSMTKEAQLMAEVVESQV